MAGSQGDRPIARQDQASVWRKIVRLLSLSPPGGIKIRTRAGRPFWCPTLLVAGFVACLPLVGASSASAPGSSTSGMSSQQKMVYAVGSATFLLLILGLINFWCKCHKRGRGDAVLGALDVLIRPVQERPNGMYMSVASLEEGKVKGLVFDSRV